jgi:hypothetical protein
MKRETNNKLDGQLPYTLYGVLWLSQIGHTEIQLYVF